MPYLERKKLVDILNAGETWKTLAGEQMGYDYVKIEKFKLAACQYGNSPADALLTEWATKNHSVTKLYKLLKKMNHFQAMEAIKHLVPEKYHEIQTHQNFVKTVPEVHSNEQMPPPPPFKYSQAQKSIEQNLDKPDDKGYNLKKLEQSQPLSIPNPSKKI